MDLSSTLDGIYFKLKQLALRVEHKGIPLEAPSWLRTPNNQEQDQGPAAKPPRSRNMPPPPGLGPPRPTVKPLPKPPRPTGKPLPKPPLPQTFLLNAFERAANEDAVESARMVACLQMAQDLVQGEMEIAKLREELDESSKGGVLQPRAGVVTGEAFDVERKRVHASHMKLKNVLTKVLIEGKEKEVIKKIKEIKETKGDDTPRGRKVEQLRMENRSDDVEGGKEGKGEAKEDKENNGNEDVERGGGTESAPDGVAKEDGEDTDDDSTTDDDDDGENNKGDEEYEEKHTIDEAVEVANVEVANVEVANVEVANVEVANVEGVEESGREESAGVGGGGNSEASAVCSEEESREWGPSIWEACGELLL